MAGIDTPSSSPQSQPKQPDKPSRPEEVETFENIPLTKKMYLPANTPIYSAPDGTECARYDKPALFHVLTSPANTPKGWLRIGTSRGKEVGWAKNAIDHDPESDTHRWSTRLAVRMNPEERQTYDTDNSGFDGVDHKFFRSDESTPIYFPAEQFDVVDNTAKIYAYVGKPFHGNFRSARSAREETTSDRIRPTYPLMLQPNVKGKDGEPVNELGYLVPRETLEGVVRIVEQTGEDMETMLRMEEWSDKDGMREKLGALARIELLLLTGDMPPGGRGSDKTARMIEHLRSMKNPHRVQVLPILLSEGPDAVAARATESKTNFEVYMRYFRAQQKRMGIALRQEAAESMYEDGRKQTLMFVRPNELP